MLLRVLAVLCNTKTLVDILKCRLPAEWPHKGVFTCQFGVIFTAGFAVNGDRIECAGSVYKLSFVDADWCRLENEDYCHGHTNGQQI